MAEPNWIQIGATLLGGGAVGALITLAVSSYRARQQPIGHRIELVPVFRQSRDSRLSADLAVSYDDAFVTFKNLFLAKVEVVNQGNKDLETFELGLTLSKGARCIYVEVAIPNRHRSASFKNIVTPLATREEIDLTLKPFNRKDLYGFKLYLVIPETESEPGGITVGSPQPVQFVEIIPFGGKYFANLTATLGLILCVIVWFGVMLASLRASIGAFLAVVVVITAVFSLLYSILTTKR